MIKCEEVKAELFDYITGRLDPSLSKMIKEHLELCKDCKKEEKELKSLLSLLDTVRPPEVSPDFVQRVMKRIESIEPVEPEEESFLKGVTEFFKGVTEKISLPFKKLPILVSQPIPALATVAILFLIVFISYNLFMPTKEKIPKKMEIITVSPITITTPNPQLMFSDLKEVVNSYGGKILKREEIPQAIKVTLRLNKEKESAFIASLKSLGKVEIGKDYKDKDGNIIIILTKKNP
ncbi:MAG TPA: hypothetical protein ENF30_03300 [Candidatus Desulfofervidus auxilii]|uniref:Putative zinc-finger domain-containing protein n=1 Tax=Desulfofervidus auxilii TaxID=1621989 RepID=A0A7V0IAP0_DESA2|nr:hypothetical protein [Candidatus Desulfofervidus auxilii]